jgi:hypothetical protein
MSRTTDSPHLPATSNTDVTVSVDGHVCPFCGLTREITDEFDPATPCPRCTLADTPATRSATKTRIGPWHVRQVRNPWAPGMGFETLLALVKRGQVTKDSIVRGPTTNQLWKRAGEIKGLSREFGLCFSCQGEIDRQSSLCQHCNRLQEPPINPDVLIEGREPVVAPVDTSAKAQAKHHTPSKSERREKVEDRSHQESHELREYHDEPAHIDIGSTTLDLSADEMLAADEAALARQITSRPPSATPMPPPAPSPARPPRTRPRGSSVDDALLTPQELAQAFQLGFAPNGQPKSPPKKEGRSKLAIAIVLLMIIGGAAALASLRPELRREATTWTSEKWTELRANFAPAPKAPPRPVITADVNLDETPVAATQPKREPQVIAPPPAVEPRPAQVADTPPVAVPASSPAVAKLDPPASAPTPLAPPAIAESVPPPVAPTTVAVAIPAPPAAEPVPAVDVQIRPPDPSTITPATKPAPIAPPAPEPLVDPEEQARTLWRKAIDAEVNQDYVEAVACYEKIKKLPADVQPFGIDLRLDQAKKLAK